jgi:protein SCO1
MITPAHRLCTLAIAAAAFTALGCRREPPQHGMLIVDPQPAPALRLADAQGRAFDLGARKGDITFVYFGYTHCPDVCPTTLGDWARARASLGPKGAAMNFVFVSVDPERDTPAIVQAYAHQFDSSFVGLVASVAQLDTIKAAWGFAVEREDMPGMKPGEYGVGHPAGVYFIDRDGRMKFIFAPGTKSAELASDMKRLL